MGLEIKPLQNATVRLCNLQSLLRNETSIALNSLRNGWNAICCPDARATPHGTDRMFRVFSLIGMIIGGGVPLVHAACLSEPGVAREVCRPAEIFVYLDQKTIVAGEGSVLLAAELLTEAGTSPPDDTLVHFFMRNGESVSRRIAFTDAGLARARMPLTEQAGALEVWAEAGRAKAAIQWLEIVPDGPVPFSLMVNGCRPDRLCQIEAKGLQDQYGNRLPDGVQGILTTHVRGNPISQQAVYTVRGGILAPWRQPDLEARVRLTLAGQRADLWVAP